ncbi:DNA methylase [Candidatus Methanoperedenaceae archaeon GB37]|nr:DNA methylase [Candidatus Methanoperedenaceae archaeon GB37]
MRDNRGKKGTKTSSFGSPGRINHDSTPFYTSKLYEGLPEEEKVKYVENPVPPQFLDKIFCKSSERMEELPDNSVHLMVTSPPYNVGKEYDESFTWLSPANPTLRDVHEYILVFSKGMFSRKNMNKRESTISRDEFLEFTKSVWTFPAEPARKIGHPAPFPVELPYRLIQLYTYRGEVVLDPFMGSGQTAIAALKADRHYAGYEIEEEYVKLSEMRINEFLIGYESPTLFSFTE